MELTISKIHHAPACYQRTGNPFTGFFAALANRRILEGPALINNLADAITIIFAGAYHLLLVRSALEPWSGPNR